MARYFFFFFLIIGILLILFPVAIFGLEIINAHLHDLTEEEKGWIGAAPLIIGFFITFPIGGVSLLIAFLLRSYRKEPTNEAIKSL